MRSRELIRADDIPAGNAAIYGTGERGADVFHALRRIRPDVEVSFFVDSFAEGEMEGLPVIRVDDPRLHECGTVILASAYREAIEVALDQAGYRGDALFAGIRLLGTMLPRFEHFILEMTTACNMDCAFCPRVVSLRNNHRMPTEDALRYIDEIADLRLAPDVHLMGHGEPLLHPDFFDIADHCLHRGLRPSTTTNGLLLTPESYPRLLDRNVRMIEISLHNLTETGYIYRRPKPAKPFAAYLDDILACAAVHARTRPGFPLQLLVSFLDPGSPTARLWEMPELEEQGRQAEELLRRFAARLEAALDGVADVRFDVDEALGNLRHIWTADMVHRNVQEVAPNVVVEVCSLQPLVIDYMRAVQPELDRLARFEPSAGQPCDSARRPNITYDGGVYPCCVIPRDEEHHREMRLGTAREPGDLFRILASDRSRRFFESVAEGDFTRRYCGLCRGWYHPPEGR